MGSRIWTAILLEELPERLRTLHFALQQTRLRGAEQQPAAQINDILPAALSFDLWVSVVGHGFHLRTFTSIPQMNSVRFKTNSWQIFSMHFIRKVQRTVKRSK